MDVGRFFVSTLFLWPQTPVQIVAQVLRQIRQGIPAAGAAAQGNQPAGHGAEDRGAASVHRQAGVDLPGGLQAGHQRIGQGSQLAATCVGTFGQSGLLAKVDGQQPVGAHPLGGDLLQIVHQFILQIDQRAAAVKPGGDALVLLRKAVAGHTLQNLFFRGKIFVHGAFADARGVGQLLGWS